MKKKKQKEVFNYIDSFDEFIFESADPKTKDKIIQKYIKKIFSKEKIKNGFKKFFENLKQEGKEYKEASQILSKYAQGDKPTPEEVKIVKKQLMDTFKILGAGAIFMLPAGSILLPLLVKLAQKWNVNILPSAFDPKNKQDETRTDSQ